jgi:hypothetical protein
MASASVPRQASKDIGRIVATVDICSIKSLGENHSGSKKDDDILPGKTHTPSPLLWKHIQNFNLEIVNISNKSVVE